MSPYNYSLNNPINVVDPDGNDIYILTWFSKGGETGHAVFAINYKTQEKKDANENVIIEQVKEGNFTYYDLWPKDRVEKAELQDNFAADYSKGIKINSLDDLKNSDPTKHRSGNVSPEGSAADGIVKISTTYDQDVSAKKPPHKI